MLLLTFGPSRRAQEQRGALGCRCILRGCHEVGAPYIEMEQQIDKLDRCSDRSLRSR